MAVKKNDLQKLTELLSELTLLGGVSGVENEVRAYIEEKAQPYADSIRTDAMGNLIVFKKGKRRTPKLMISAHMDEIGLIVTKVTDEGYLKVAPVGGIDIRVVFGRKVYVGPNEIPGVLGLKAIHLTTQEERTKIPKWSDLYVDIGVSSKDDALELVSLGDVCVFDSDYVRIGTNEIKAKAIDDRFGCAVMLRLLEEKLPVDTCFVFTVQEEVGTRGAFGAAFSVKPDLALVLEGTTSADFAGVPDPKKVTYLGAGPVIGFMDAGTIYDRGLFEQIRDLAISKNIPWQIKGRIAGGTDASAIQRSREGVRVASISAPIRNIHSPNTVADLRDIENAYELARAFVLSI